MQFDRVHARQHPRDGPQTGQVNQSQQAEKEGRQSQAAQQVLRALAESGEKLDGQQVEEAFDESADSILRAAELSRTVVDHDFPYPIPPRGGQGRQEAMQFAIEPHFVEDLAAIALEPAVVVVQFHAR